MTFLNKLGKPVSKLFNSTAAGLYMLLFAISIGAATFIENDFGTSAAQKLVYQSTWFEILLVLFCITLAVNVVKYKLIKRKLWALVIFHLSMIVIIIGAGITRYISYEGVMHIREGSSSNVVYSSNTYLNFQAQHQGQLYEFQEPVLFASVGDNSFHETYIIGNEKVDVAVKKVIPNPERKLVTTDSGQPTIKIVFGGAGGREEYFLQQGEQRRLHGLLFNFTDRKEEDAFNIRYQNDELLLNTNRLLSQMVMATQTRDTLTASADHPLRLRSLYDNGQQQFVFGEFNPAAEVVMEAGNQKIESSSTLGVLLDVTIGDEKFERYIYGNKGNTGRPEVFQTNSLALSVAYGARMIEVPFNLYLHDFIMERYPGTNSPASFASEVTLNDPDEGVEQDYRIYMNNILDYKGYRFFQSSYDRDEKGTYLSVNHDALGTAITYIGYALLTLGLVMIFFSKDTRFRKLSKKIRKIRKSQNAPVVLLALLPLLAFSSDLKAQKEMKPAYEVVSKEHAENFSTVVVQDIRGRMKPMHTLTRELMRKVHGSETMDSHNADQVILSMYANKSSWYAIPFVKLGKHDGIAKELGIAGQKKAAYRDFFNEEGKYKLADEITRANNTKPAERGVYEKQLIKVDERLNIMSMIFSGSFFRVVPLENDPNNTWVSERTQGQQQQDRTVANAFFSAYRDALHQSIHSGDYSLPNQIISELKVFQKEVGAEVMPSEAKLKAEIMLNKSKVFNRLALYYFLLGMLFLILLFYSVFRPNSRIAKLHNVFIGLVVFGFALHTLGLGLRWYVSGRAPWSNGYESMIYIGWTATLAGVLFTRRSLGGMAATLVLSGTVLLIAMLSYLDPEITPLVPVLKSYWLTIHVSLEAGSYGFLMLGAIIGLINLLLIGVTTSKNKLRIVRIVKEMSYISEMTLIGGLVMLSIGTYLGGVWANESWGRYWGWDAKETWALVSILVYAFILHMRIIPGLKGLFAYNFATLFGLSSIIMTYFGVNYYLSGLHSYAAGDPVPIPNWVYIAIVVITVISAWAFVRKRKFKLS
jgi:cytochrome c-type biogenesis protein CcsB